MYSQIWLPYFFRNPESQAPKWPNLGSRKTCWGPLLYEAEDGRVRIHMVQFWCKVILLVAIWCFDPWQNKRSWLCCVSQVSALTIYQAHESVHYNYFNSIITVIYIFFKSLPPYGKEHTIEQDSNLGVVLQDNPTNLGEVGHPTRVIRLFTVPYFFVRSSRCWDIARLTVNDSHLDFQMYRGCGRRDYSFDTHARCSPKRKALDLDDLTEK